MSESMLFRIPSSEKFVGTPEITPKRYASASGIKARMLLFFLLRVSIASFARAASLNVILIAFRPALSKACAPVIPKTILQIDKW